MNYRSVADLSRTLARSTHLLPRDLEVVVGVPRSGLLAANLLALHLNLPLTDVDGLVAGRLFTAGSRQARGASPTFLQEPRTVLVLDDSVYTGLNIQRTRASIEAAGLPHRVTYEAVYAHPDAKGLVDFYYEVVAPPRVFEWNVLHGPWIGNACVDIDGVLCEEPGDRDDDGARFLEFIRTARPLYTVGARPGWLVTCRLEKYRAPTEAWLTEQGIEYGALHMLDLPDAETRRRLRPYAEFKARVYKETGAEIFIESSPVEAAGIARISGKPVYCVSTREMVQPTGATGLTYQAAVKRGRLGARVRRLLARVRDKARRMLGG